MEITVIICEYNPFHFGHAYQIKNLKERFDTVVCILGGNISQRGEAAVSDRYIRAKAALQNGADLVVELPAPWCCASAREFAAGGVFLAKELGWIALPSLQKVTPPCCTPPQRSEQREKPPSAP